MTSLLRGTLLAALVVALVVPLTSASADKPGGKPDKAAQGQGKAKNKRFSALIFSKTAAFRHTECIPSGTVAIAQMAVPATASRSTRRRTPRRSPRRTSRSTTWSSSSAPPATCSTTRSRRRSRATSRAAAGTRASTPRPTPSTTGPGTAAWSARTSVTIRATVSPQFQTATMERRGPAQRRHEAAASGAGRARRSGTTSGPTRASGVHVLCVDESTYDPRGYSVARRFRADGRPPDLLVPRLRRRPLVLHGAGAQGIYWDEPKLLAHVWAASRWPPA